MRYQVDMQRVVTQQATIEVEASDEREARKKAIDGREKYEWSATDTDYNSIDIQEIP